eukprot:14382576-Alexandrium_andersonii.AAC.1
MIPVRVVQVARLLPGPDVGAGGALDLAPGHHEQDLHHAPPLVQPQPEHVEAVLLDVAGELLRARHGAARVLRTARVVELRCCAERTSRAARGHRRH